MTILVPSHWRQPSAKGRDISLMAGWTDTPDTPPPPTPSDPSKGHPGPGVVGHGVRASLESQNWGDLRRRQVLHVYDEGQGGEVTPSPEFVGDMVRSCMSDGPAFQDVRGHRQHYHQELPNSSMRSEQGAHPIFPGVETVLSAAQRPDGLVLFGLQYCLRGNQADGNRVPGSTEGSAIPFYTPGSRPPQGRVQEVGG